MRGATVAIFASFGLLVIAAVVLIISYVRIPKPQPVKKEQYAYNEDLQTNRCGSIFSPAAYVEAYDSGGYRRDW